MGSRHAQFVLGAVIVGCQIGQTDWPIKQVGASDLTVHSPRFELRFLKAQGSAGPMDSCPANGLHGPGRQIGKVLGDTPGARSGALVEPGDFIKHRPLVIDKIFYFKALACLKEDDLDSLLAQLVSQSAAASTGANDDHDAV